MKRPSILSVIALSLSFFITPFAQANFVDVETSHPFKDAIDYVKTQGIVNGYSDGSYKPNNKINRAEFTKIIIEATFPKQATGENCFSDVKSEWFANYVCFAQQNGVIEGYPDGTFNPNQNISFAEAAKIIAGAFGYPANKDNIWYKPFVMSLEEKKGIPTSIISFSQQITRGEMAEIIYRLKSNITTKASQSYNKLAISSEIPKEDAAAQSQGIVYSNSKYGFALTFPQTWKGYTTTNRTLNWGTYGTSDSIDFGFFIQDSLFNVSIHNKSQWQQIKSEEGPTPTYLGENNQYVFGYGRSGDPGISNIPRIREIQDIVKTFLNIPISGAILLNIEGSTFSNQYLIINVGDTVTWTNQDNAPHTVTSQSGTELKSDTLSKGQTYSHTFNEAGTFSYFCTIHPSMKGTVIAK